MRKFLVFQSDFGLADGAVSAMEGVSYEVASDINIRHLTHEITPYNVFEASYRLFQTISYWPSETVFVSVVDPGVGSNRLSIVVKTSNNQYIVTPNNGTLSHIKKFVGIESVRVIDENVNRLKGSLESYTFHGRDVYAYTGARLASGTISFEEVGKEISVDDVVSLGLFETIINENEVIGQVDILDGNFGSLWTSIHIDDFKKLNIKIGDYCNVVIKHNNVIAYSGKIKYGHSFADVDISSLIIYMNSVYHMAIAINQGSFAKAYNIGVGPGWTVSIKKSTI